MFIKVQYNNTEEREQFIRQHNHLFLIEEQNITEGNFLIFSDVLPEPPTVLVSVPQEEYERIKQDNTLLKAQNQANSDRADFHEEVLAEIILTIN